MGNRGDSPARSVWKKISGQKLQTWDLIKFLAKLRKVHVNSGVVDIGKTISTLDRMEASRMGVFLTGANTPMHSFFGTLGQS